jgi:tripeptidyl-peptidase-1
MQSIPQNIKNYIEFIDFNNQRKNIKIHKKINSYSSIGVDPGFVTREVFTRVYNINNTITNQKVSIGAMEYQGGNGFSDIDLKDSEVKNGVPINPITTNHIIGTNNMPDGESQLDVQVMYWGTPSATLWYEDYKGQNDNGWMYSWANNFMNRKDVPQVVSVSWGWNELDQCAIGICDHETAKQYVERTNIEFMKIVARGVTIVVASGDAGSPGRTNEQCEPKNNTYGYANINPVFPGGSPWVLSVGATYIAYNSDSRHFTTPICTNTSGVKCATGSVEQGTTYSETGWTSGAGFTHWNPAPSWQAKYVQSYLNSGIRLPDRKYFNSNNRAYPDVSAFGHNCFVMYGNTPETEDGTSCASPIFAGVITQLNAYQLSKNRPLLGFINPLLYHLYDVNQKTFNDVLVGDSAATETMSCNRNFGFLATKGWDPVSGLGTPNVGEMKKTLDKLFQSKSSRM